MLRNDRDSDSNPPPVRWCPVPAGNLADRTRRTQHNAGTGVFQGTDHGGVIVAIQLPMSSRVGAIAMIIHT